MPSATTNVTGGNPSSAHPAPPAAPQRGEQVAVRRGARGAQGLHEPRDAFHGAGVVVGEAVGDGQEAEARRGGLGLPCRGAQAAEVVVRVEERDVEAGAEETRGEVEEAVEVALRRDREHQHVRHVRRRRLRHVRAIDLHCSSAVCSSSARRWRPFKGCGVRAQGMRLGRKRQRRRHVE